MFGFLLVFPWTTATTGFTNLRPPPPIWRIMKVYVQPIPTQTLLGGP